MTDQPASPDDLERTFRDFLDPDYVAALEDKADGLGFDPAAAAAAELARASEAIATNGQAFFVMPYSRQTGDPASGPVQASGPVLVARTGSAQVEARIPAGTALSTDMLDSTGAQAQLQPFVLAEEVVLDVGELGPVTAQAVATRPGNQGNLLAGTLTGFAAQGVRVVHCTADGSAQLVDTGVSDVFSAGDVGRYLQLAAHALPVRILSYGQGANAVGTVVLEQAVGAGAYDVTLLEWADLGITLEQPSDITNGRHAQLDAIGRESLTNRGPGESDPDYAYRIASLPDVVSPNAIAKICAQILSPYGITYSVHETQIDMPGFVLDRTPLDAASTCLSGCAWDGSALMTVNAQRRFFVICVDTNENANAYGLPRDAVNAGINAYDVGSGPGDGRAVGNRNALRTLYQAILDAHLYGTGFEILLRRAYQPWQFLPVDITADLTDTTTPYVTAATAGLKGFFQEARGTVQPWELQQAIEAALARAGLNPSVALLSVSDLTAGDRQQLQLGTLTVS